LWINKRPPEFRLPCSFDTILGGLAGHQSRRFTQHIESGWRNLAEHGIGGILLVPFILLFWLANGGDVKDIPRLLASVLMALLGVGAGVSVGWMMDQLMWRES